MKDSSKEDEKNGMYERTAEEMITEKVRAINPKFDYGETHEDVFRALWYFFDPPVARKIVLAAMEEYKSLSKVEQVEQDLSAIDEAIKYFEDLKTKAVKLHELVFFDVVLAVLDGIKTKRLTRRSSTVEK